MDSIPRIEDLDLSWLAKYVDIPPGASLTSDAVGAGQVATCVRLSVNSPDATMSFIAKGPSRDSASIGAAQLQKLYLRESSFYAFLASRIETRTPECFFVDRDEEDNFLLLLEDLSPAMQVDQFEGVTKDMAKNGLRELSGLHAATLNDVELHNAKWLRGVSASLAPLMGQILPVLFDQFIERYEETVDSEVLNFVKKLREKLDAFRVFTPYAECVTHGDFRTDNLLFNAQDGAVPLCVVDWQTVGVASPFLDVAYFLTTSLTEADREQFEDELLVFYLDEMERRGAVIPLDVAREEFARFTLQPVVMLVCAAVLVERTERGDRMFFTMIKRGIAAALKWHALEGLDNRVDS